MTRPSTAEEAGKAGVLLIAVAITFGPFLLLAHVVRALWRRLTGPVAGGQPKGRKP